MTAAAVWVRVSTGHQDSDNQVPDVERFTARHGYDVAGTCTVSERGGGDRHGGGDDRQGALPGRRRPGAGVTRCQL